MLFVASKISKRGGKLSKQSKKVGPKYTKVLAVGSTRRMCTGGEEGSEGHDPNLAKWNKLEKNLLDSLVQERDADARLYDPNFLRDLRDAIASVGKKYPVTDATYNFLNFNKNMSHFIGPLKDPVRVAVTGASGNIGYSLLFRIASGELFGPRQPVHLQLLEIPGMENKMNGVVMELNDCAFPLLSGITATTDANKGFEGTDWAILVGAKPRGKGMERGDLIKENANIFSQQGKALNGSANANCKVVVVGNPANTNALIAQTNAPKLKAENFSALTRLDHNRGLSVLMEKLGVKKESIKRFAIWGNHSATQYPDLSHTQITKDGSTTAAKTMINDDKWIKDVFIPKVQKRGAEIIQARGASSAASAAGAAIDHIRDWHFGTRDWVSVALPSKGDYGVTPGLFFSYPVICGDEGPEIVKDVPIDPFSAEKMEATHKELLKERDTVAHLLK